MQKGKQFLSDLKLYSDYLKWREEDNRFETWEEACESILEGHKKKYHNKEEELDEFYNKALKLMKSKTVLASQRNLQFRGPQIEKHNTKLYNCFEEHTSFITNKGVKSFKEFESGDKCVVKTHTGSWKNAVVKSYGKQDLYQVEFSKGSHKHYEFVTKNHRWILKDGKETTSLKVGDKLYQLEDTFKDFIWEDAPDIEKLYWCYGLVYGDGTVDKNGYSKIRLCNNDVKYEYRFLELGFSSSSSASIKGDTIVFTGKYQKTTPDLEKDSPELIRAFVHGYLCADGEKNRNPSGKQFNGIQSSQEDHIDFIRKAFPIAGVYILNEEDLTGQKTNFGTRPHTIKFSTYEGARSSYDKPWTITDIEFYNNEIVWCLEVEDDYSFVLANGIVTGNCTSTYIAYNKVFQNIFYLGLSGCGVGGGLLIPFVDSISRIQTRTKGAKTFIIQDSVEGWADSLGILMSSFFTDKQPFPEYAGYEIKFDYSLIREKGAYISGGFKAPGPEGLQDALDKIENLLNNWLMKEGNKIRPILAFDIICHASDAVLSGGVRRSALNMIVDPNDKEMIFAKTGNWRQENPQRARSNNSVILLREEVTKDLFKLLVDMNEGDSDIGFVFANSWFDMFNPCFEILKIPMLYEGNLDQIKYEELPSFVKEHSHLFGIQGCVSYNTKLITKEGIEEIGYLAENKIEVDIWNGEKWSTVTPVKTNSDVNLYRVTFSDGSYLDTTSYHRFLVKNRFQKDFEEKTTLQIEDLLRESKYPLQIPRSNIKYTEGVKVREAYDYGFILGDGTCKPYANGKDRKPFACVYEPNFKLDFPFVTGTKSKILYDDWNGKKSKYYNVSFDVDYKFAQKLKYENGLPKELFTWNKESIRNFVAGWIDTDGTITYNNKVRIYGEESKIRDLQLLLTKIGTDSSVNLMASKGEVTNVGTRNRDVWYVQISNCEGLWCSKTNLYGSEVKFKGKYQIIKSIEKLEGLHDSYCFEEFDLHQGVFNNVLTKQCNLTEINAEVCNTKEKFFEACEAASILGTLQAGYTSFPYLGKVSEDIFKREALIGVSVTGWMNNPSLFDKELLRAGVRIVVDTNKKIAKIIGINQAARTTCVKPSGNASVILGTASGIHPDHSERLFRIMQLNKESDTAKWLEKNMPYLLEDSVWSSTGTDYVVYVPIENPEDGLFKSDMKGVKHLELIKFVQDHWVNPGTNRELCAYPNVNHNTSNTVIIDDKDGVVNYIWDNKESFTAVSFISDYGDKDFNQAPFTSVSNLYDIITEYGKGALFISGLIVDGLHYFNENLWRACDVVKNKDIQLHGTKEQVLLKKYWIRRVKQFARNFFDGDVSKTIYCIKDVHLLHKWEVINRKFNTVNFSKILSKPHYKSVSDYAATACSGGSCEITRI